MLKLEENYFRKRFSVAYLVWFSSQVHWLRREASSSFDSRMQSGFSCNSLLYRQLYYRIIFSLRFTKWLGFCHVPIYRYCSTFSKYGLKYNSNGPSHSWAVPLGKSLLYTLPQKWHCSEPRWIMEKYAVPDWVEDRDGGSVFSRNVGKPLPHHTASYTKRLLSKGSLAF